MTRGAKPPPTAHERALEALGRRARSTQELSRWLRERDYGTEEVAEVVKRLTASGLLDDAAYSLTFARSRLLDRKLSRRRVLSELGRRGVSRDVASAAVNAVVEDEGVDDVAAAAQVAEKKFRSLARLDPVVAKRRLMGFLLRRGYDLDAAKQAVARVSGRPS